VGDRAVFLPAREQDWDWAQVQYETTSRPIQDIATNIGVPATSIISRASRNGWTRDKGKLVAKMTAEMVIANRVRESEQRQEKLAVIERVNAEMQARVLTEHRKDIQKARGLFVSFMGELERNEDEMDLEGKVKTLSKLTDSMKTLILLERQAFGIQGVFEDTDRPPPSPTEQQQVDAVMSKFAAVLAKKMGAVEVLQNDA